MKRMDFTGFIAALFNDWVSKMSGLFSILFAALGFIPHKKFNIFTKPAVQRTIFWSMALLCFFLASVSVWTNEHQNAFSLANQLKKEKENNSPNIVLEEQQFLAFTGDTSNNSLFLNLVVKNIGSPSVVVGWKLNIKFPNGTPLEIRPTRIQQGMKILYKGKIMAKFHQNNRLEEKTIIPIQRGDLKSGWLWFKLPDVKTEQLKSSSIILYAQDIMGKEYSIKVDISNVTSNYNDLYIPGSGDAIFKHKN